MVTAWSPDGTHTGRPMTADRLAAHRSGWDGAVELIDAQVRDVVRREGIDPLRDPAAVNAIVATVVREYDERSLTGVVPPIGDVEAVSREVHDRVAGFGHQAINALFPAAAGDAPPPPGPRLYSGADDSRFQELRHRLEGGWVEMLCSRVGVDPVRLPLLWDLDFLLGERGEHEPERYVLCEINVSSVSPFPESAIAPLVEATREALSIGR